MSEVFRSILRGELQGEHEGYAIDVDTERKTMRWVRPPYKEHLPKNIREPYEKAAREAGYTWVADCEVCGNEYERQPDQRRPVCGSVKCKIEYTRIKED